MRIIYSLFSIIFLIGIIPWFAGDIESLVNYCSGPLCLDTFVTHRGSVLLSAVGLPTAILMLIFSLGSLGIMKKIAQTLSGIIHFFILLTCTAILIAIYVDSRRGGGGFNQLLGVAFILTLLLFSRLTSEIKKNFFVDSPSP